MNKNPSFKYEESYWNKGFSKVIGLDEVGRGAFAGPVVAAGVILPKDFKINGIRDSKLLTHLKRVELSKYIQENSLSYVISEVSIEYINKFGIGKATEKAFVDCVNKIKNFDIALIDGYKINGIDVNKQEGVIRGDRVSVSIAAASIIAKVYRDNIMINLHTKFPEYNFSQNKGYGTLTHRQSIGMFGLSVYHRTSFNLSRYLI